jgi:hypothetical protein
VTANLRAHCEGLVSDLERRELLDLEKDDIRLLTILNTHSATVSCTLETLSFQYLPTYKALSYCWGDEDNKASGYD